MESLKFGNLLRPDKAGNEIEIGRFALHLQSPWRFVSNTSILVGSLDLYEPVHENSEYDENFNWDTPNGNLRDVKLQALIRSQELIVTSFLTDNFGGFELFFSHQIKMSVFPADSKIGEYSEFWRLINNLATRERHFVIGGSGVQHDKNGL